MSNLHLSARSHPLKENLWVIKQCFKTGDSSVSSSSFFSYLPILYICYFFLILMAGWGLGKLLCPVSCMLLFLWFVGDGPNVWFLHLSLSESKCMISPSLSFWVCLLCSLLLPVVCRFSAYLFWSSPNPSLFSSPIDWQLCWFFELTCNKPSLWFPCFLLLIFLFYLPRLCWD